MRFMIAPVALLTVPLLASVGLPQTMQKQGLTLEGARQVIAAAVSEAKNKNAPGAAIAVVDEGGNLIALERLDNTFASGANISIGKARTAALFKRPTGFFEEVINKGRTAMTALNDFTPLQGGIPIVVDGQIVGAIGVSGAASAQQDEEIANAGAANFAAAIKSRAAPITYLPAKEVKYAFIKGAPLVGEQNYKIAAGHRDGPGIVEIHSRDTDIIYVLEGTATLVTGGTPIDAKMIEPGEIRARESSGGDRRVLTAGDVIVIPNGTPHWFKEVKGALNYYVVKVRSAD